MILDQLLTIGFLTGSRAFGTNRDDSDYDIVFSIEDSVRVNEIIGKLEKTPSNYFAGYYVYDNGITINLIPVHPHEFLPWYLATKAMKATLATSGITSPIKKCAVFSGMVALYKGTVEELQNLGKYIELKEKILALENRKETPKKEIEFQEGCVNDWLGCSYRLPDEGVVVMTKIDDANGCRNEQELKRMGRLWFYPDASMYVYYTPTHWKSID